MKKLIVFFLSIAFIDVMQARKYTVYFDVDQNDNVTFISSSGSTYVRNTVTLKVGDTLKITHQNMKNVVVNLQVDNEVLEKNKKNEYTAQTKGNANLIISGTVTKKHSNKQYQDISFREILRVTVTD